MKQLPITRILLATDFSGCAEQALEYAAFLVKACPAPVEILHVAEVLPDMQPDDAAERYFDLRRKQAEKPLDELVQKLTSMGVTARWRQHLGIPSRDINRAAEELGADLVTLGAYRPDQNLIRQHRPACSTRLAVPGADRSSLADSQAGDGMGKALRHIGGAPCAGAGGLFILFSGCTGMCGGARNTVWRHAHRSVCHGTGVACLREGRGLHGFGAMSAGAGGIAAGGSLPRASIPGHRGRDGGWRGEHR